MATSRYLVSRCCFLLLLPLLFVVIIVVVLFFLANSAGLVLVLGLGLLSLKEVDSGPASLRGCDQQEALDQIAQDWNSSLLRMVFRHLKSDFV